MNPQLEKDPLQKDTLQKTTQQKATQPNDTQQKVIIWFRRDLRIADNPCLDEAIKRSLHVIPVYIDDDSSRTVRTFLDVGKRQKDLKSEEFAEDGAASKWWLHHSLTSLKNSLLELGLELIIRRGNSKEIITEIQKVSNAEYIFWSRVYEPHFINRDIEIKKFFKAQNVEVLSFNSSLLLEPWEIKNGQNKPYQVYTPFWKSLSKTYQVNCPPVSCPQVSLPPEDALPETLAYKENKIHSEQLQDLKLLPKINWDKEFYNYWQPGEASAKQRLKEFLNESVSAYAEKRNNPDVFGTSRLSPHLHFGEISPRQIWQEVFANSKNPAEDKGTETFLKEVVWREFAYHLLYHFSETVTKPLKKEFEQFPWITDVEYSQKLFTAWKKGLTGYPIVDAGMRELWTTGWMHNRVRMVVASFLVKDLLIPWQEGAKWFWDTLVDADLASNTLGWQWVSGCGADAAPYFRVFNPVLQGEKFDAEGQYVKKWVPELRNMPHKYLHKPWEASEEELKSFGVILGETYPQRIVIHEEARDFALEAYSKIMESKKEHDKKEQDKK